MYTFLAADMDVAPDMGVEFHKDFALELVMLPRGEAAGDASSLSRPASTSTTPAGSTYSSALTSHRRIKHTCAPCVVIWALTRNPPRMRCFENALCKEPSNY